MGTFHRTQQDVGHPHSVCNVWIKVQILETPERQPTINMTSAAHTFSKLYIIRTAVMSLLYSVNSKVNTTQFTCKMCILQMDSATISQLTLCLQQRFHSQMNHTSPGLGSPTFTTVWSDENPCMIYCHYQQKHFSVNLWPGRWHWLPHSTSYFTIFVFFAHTEVDYWKMCPAMRLRMWFQHNGAPPHHGHKCQQLAVQKFPWMLDWLKT